MSKELVEAAYNVISQYPGQEIILQDLCREVHGVSYNKRFQMEMDDEMKGVMNRVIKFAREEFDEMIVTLRDRSLSENGYKKKGKLIAGYILIDSEEQKSYYNLELRYKVENANNYIDAHNNFVELGGKLNILDKFKQFIGIRINSMGNIEVDKPELEENNN